MKKLILLGALSLPFMSSVHAHRTIKDKLEGAIEKSNFRKVRAVLHRFNANKPSSQERRDLMTFLSRTASDVAIDRKESLSLTGSLYAVATFRDREKAQDLGLLGAGLVLAGLGIHRGYKTWTDYSAGPGPDVSEYRAGLAKNGGLSTLGCFFGMYLLGKGFRCTVQKNALTRAKDIETYIKQLPK